MRGRRGQSLMRTLQPDHIEARPDGGGRARSTAGPAPRAHDRRPPTPKGPWVKHVLGPEVFVDGLVRAPSALSSLSGLKERVLWGWGCRPGVRQRNCVSLGTSPCAVCPPPVQRSGTQLHVVFDSVGPKLLLPSNLPDMADLVGAGAGGGSQTQCRCRSGAD